MRHSSLIVGLFALVLSGSCFAQTKEETERFLFRDIQKMEFEQRPTSAERISQPFVQELFATSRVENCQFWFDESYNHNYEREKLRKASFISIDLTQIYANTIHVEDRSTVSVVGGQYFGFVREWKAQANPKHYQFIRFQGSERLAAAFKYFTSNWCKGLKSAF